MTGVTTTDLRIALPERATQRPAFTMHGDHVVLVVVSGPTAGTRLELLPGADGVIGTATDATLVLDDKTVSRQHLRARWDGQALELEDLGSKNGSFYERARFHHLTLRAGDEFRVGATAIKILPDETVVSPVPAAGGGYGALVGDSVAMRAMYAMVSKVAPSDASVVLEGETGVGKELVANELHRRSHRHAKPLVVFDCGAVPEELLESLLFGHVRGSFTGAVRDQPGVFAAADGGTVFLDEIGELAIGLQPALLRVLDQGLVRAVGATEYRRVDVRVIAATHRDLPAMIAAGRFREDLYYRLAVIRLTVPPLRARSEDVPALVAHFLRRVARGDLTVSEAQLTALRDHAWPGNVRQLRNVVERGAILATDGRLALDPAERSSPNAIASAPAATPASPGGRLPYARAKEEILTTFERAYLESLMSEFGTITAAAAAAGMDRKHLRLLLQRHGLAPT